jgi:hypothetical protein
MLARLDAGDLEAVLATVVRLRPDLAALPERAPRGGRRWLELDAGAVAAFED